jgi:hypothetical protein
MAIAFDAVTNGSFTGGGASRTFSHTCGGTNRILFVNVHTNTDVVTGVTYNSVAMTRVNGQATDFYITTWVLMNPASGANDVVVTCSASTNIIPNAISYSGVSQSGQPEVSALNSAGSGSSITSSLTTLTDNNWVMMFMRKNSGGSATGGTGTTVRVDDSTYGLHAFDSNGAISPAGSTSLIANHSTSSKWTIMVAFAPYVASGPTNLKSLSGNVKSNIKSISGNLIANVKSLSGNS